MNKRAVMDAAYDRPEEYYELRLTLAQRNMLDMIRNRGRMGSAEFSTRMCIKLSSASNQLTAMYKKGYLCRDEEPKPTGGTRFMYWVEQERWGEQ